MVGAQAATTQMEVAAKLVRQQQDVQQQMVAMLAQATKAPEPPEGTGVLLNARG